ncbi:PREDICTED: pre-mRNA-splicing factor CEF1-like [Camelina sativa]|uniref:Pre-mRNA-splicing factor CEF1-like n=1 Tax=Camelina sativa TaxID=90675 RepID=A0ABM0YWJ1_CAMSA|nr:PREDICTED: pre-mRNA-splicing factor CEF1-like [Camelina sativa]
MADEWKSHEDVLLLEGIKKYGTFRWDKISTSFLLSQRSIDECKERFKSFVEPKAWTYEDDKKLRELAHIHQPSWTTIGGLMGRDPNLCYQRFMSLPSTSVSQKVEIPTPILGDKPKLAKQKGRCMKRKWIDV